MKDRQKEWAFTVGLSSTHRKALEALWERYQIEVVDEYEATATIPQFGAEPPFAVFLFIDRSVNLELLPHYRADAKAKGYILVVTTHVLEHHERSLRLQGFYPPDGHIPESKPIVTERDAFTPRHRTGAAAIKEPTEAIPQPVAEEPPQETVMSKPLSLIPQGNDATTELDYDGVLGLLKDAIRILRDQYAVDTIHWEKGGGLEVTRRASDTHDV
jgi:hypothetical protein